MIHWEWPNMNRVIRGVVLGLPPTFFVLLHVPTGPNRGLPHGPAVDRAILTQATIGTLPPATPPP
jgi:hypothetical protein